MGNPTNKSGILITIPSNQEGADPRLVTECQPMPVLAGKGGLTTDVRGVQKVANDFSIFHSLFSFDVPPSLWCVEEDGTEIPTLSSTRATSITGRLNVRSGITAGNDCHLESRRHPRYQPDRGLKWAASVGFKGASLDGILRAGLIVHMENGVYLKTKGDGFLYACILKAGVETHEEQITFPFPIDITKGNNYDIQLKWRGIGFARFYADDPSTALPALIHEISFLNVLDEALFIDNPALSASFIAENVTQEVNLWCGCIDVSSESGVREKEQYGATSHTKTVSSDAPILAIYNPPLIGGKPNTRDINLARISVSSDKKVTVKAYITRDVAAITGGTFDVFRTGSYIERNATMTSINDALMEEISSFKVPAGGTIDRANPAREIIEFFLAHGDYLVMVCDNGSVAEVDVTIEWGEEV